jgi:hypothetical protein
MTIQRKRCFEKYHSRVPYKPSASHRWQSSGQIHFGGLRVSRALSFWQDFSLKEPMAALGQAAWTIGMRKMAAADTEIRIDSGDSHHVDIFNRDRQTSQNKSKLTRRHF